MISHALSYTLIVKFVPVFTVFLLLKHSCFQLEARVRDALILAPGGLVARTLGFHPMHHRLFRLRSEDKQLIQANAMSSLLNGVLLTEVCRLMGFCAI